MMSATSATTTQYHYQQDADTLLTRLRRIEGQVRGVQKMVVEGRYCLDIVTQIQAITAATDKVAEKLLESHVRGCVADAIREQGGDCMIVALHLVSQHSLASAFATVRRQAGPPAARGRPAGAPGLPADQAGLDRPRRRHALRRAAVSRLPRHRQAAMAPALSGGAFDRDSLVEFRTVSP